MNKSRLHLDECTTSKTYTQYVKKSLDRNHRQLLFFELDFRWECFKIM